MYFLNKPLIIFSVERGANVLSVINVALVILRCITSVVDGLENSTT